MLGFALTVRVHRVNVFAFLLAFLCLWPAHNSSASNLFRNDLQRSGSLSASGAGITSLNELVWTFASGKGAVSTPVAQGDRVYFSTSQGWLFAASLSSGKILWSYQMKKGFSLAKFFSAASVFKKFVTSEFETDPNWQQKISIQQISSPQLFDGLVIAGSPDGHVYALNAETGMLKWDVKTGGPITSSPLAVDGTVYIGSWDGNLWAIDIKTGQAKWQFAENGQQGESRKQFGLAIESSPSLAGANIVFGTLFKPTVYAINSATGKMVWRFEAEDDFSATPAVVDGTVYLGSRGGTFYALDAATGKLKWRNDLGSMIVSSASVGRTLVFVASFDGQLQALDRNDGNVKWSYAGGAAFSASPVLAEEGLGLLTSVYQALGAVKVQDETNGTIYIGNRGGEFLAIDAATGQRRWQFRSEGAINAAPLVLNGRVAFGNDEGKLFLLK